MTSPELVVVEGRMGPDSGRPNSLETVAAHIREAIETVSGFHALANPPRLLRIVDAVTGVLRTGRPGTRRHDPFQAAVQHTTDSLQGSRVTILDLPIHHDITISLRPATPSMTPRPDDRYGPALALLEASLDIVLRALDPASDPSTPERRTRLLATTLRLDQGHGDAQETRRTTYVFPTPWTDAMCIVESDDRDDVALDPPLPTTMTIDLVAYVDGSRGNFIDIRQHTESVEPGAADPMDLLRAHAMLAAHDAAKTEGRP